MRAACPRATVASVAAAVVLLGCGAPSPGDAGSPGEVPDPPRIGRQSSSASAPLSDGSRLQSQGAATSTKEWRVAAGSTALPPSDPAPRPETRGDWSRSDTAPRGGANEEALAALAQDLRSDLERAAGDLGDNGPIGRGIAADLREQYRRRLAELLGSPLRTWQSGPPGRAQN